MEQQPEKTRTLPSKREMIIKEVKNHIEFLKTNAEKLDIYEGNLLPYVESIMQTSLSPQYFNSIKHRILPINVLQRYVDKVSTAYAKGPSRKALNKNAEAFLEYYSKQFDINTSGLIADTYATMFKGFAWEPYINDDGEPKLRELPFDRFLVISDSHVNPEDETIFVKIVGNYKDTTKQDKCLLFAYTKDEFDAFHLDNTPAEQYTQENGGFNDIGVIPFIYGKRQKNRLIPTQDSDILTFTKAIPVMLSDAAGAQMFQCFTILYGIDINVDNLKGSPNAFWNIKSDKDSDKTPQIGSIKPEADTDKVVAFIINAFVLWLETKGIRVGSIGNMDGGNMANGISKIIDEMDVHMLVNKSMDWFQKDEHELWNKKLPLIHKYWIESGQLESNAQNSIPGIIDDPQIQVEFERPKPMTPRADEIRNIKDELALGTIKFEKAIRKLHPDYSEEEIKELVALKSKSNVIEEDENANNGSDNNSEKAE
jgi:hypothetical protein